MQSTALSDPQTAGRSAPLLQGMVSKEKGRGYQMSWDVERTRPGPKKARPDRNTVGGSVVGPPSGTHVTEWPPLLDSPNPLEHNI